MANLLRLIFLFSLAGHAFGQLTLWGADRLTKTVSVEDLNRLPQRTVKVKEKGKTVVYTGIPLTEVLDEISVPTGDKMKGKALGFYVLAQAADGFEATFSLAELDAEIGDRQVYVVTVRDGQPLSSEEGPIRLIVPDDKKPSRWVRQLVTLRVKAATP